MSRTTAPLRRRPSLPGVVPLALAVAATLTVTVAVAPPARAAVGVPVTYQDHLYGSTVVRPTQDKPQSKLWYHDGSWWALMVSAGGTLVTIHELMPDHTWRNTGTQVDSRTDGTGDALWSKADGKLYVATRSDSADLRVARFSYDSSGRTWAIDSGFPVGVDTGGGSESATIDQDSLGRIWVTYTRGSRVWVARSAPGGLDWTPGFQPNVPDVVIKNDDISTLLAFGTSIGVMWSDQQSGAIRFAIHRDEDPIDVWRVENALVGAGLADDHLNLKQVAGDTQGRLFAAIKTSQDAVGPDATLVGVLVRTPQPDGTGTWALVPAGTVADDHTRPILMIDQANQELYFFATAPGSGGDIYFKKTSLADPSFGPGRGTVFVSRAFGQVNNASGSKDPVTAASGMVVLATAETRKRYVHAEMDLAGGAESGDTTSPTVPTDLVSTPGTGQVTLTWTAATDDVGVTRYGVIRDGAPVASVTGTGYTDAGLTPGQTYTYAVTAVDAAGNVSGPSAPAQATVPVDEPPPVGDVALRAVTAAANNAETILTVPTPDYRAGDVLLATVDVRGSTTITPPNGWTLVREDANGTALRKATYWRVATATEPADRTWRFSTRRGAVGSISAYTGVSTSNPVQASAVATAGSRTITAPTVTTSAPGTVVVALFGIARGSAITPNTVLNERSEVRSPATVDLQLTAATADVSLPTPTTTGPLTATSTTSGPNIGHTVALNPGG